MLRLEEVAEHYGLKPDTLRRKIKEGALPAIKIGRTYRLKWTDVWSCEEGRMPRGAGQARYREPLLSKKAVAEALSVSVRSVERWIEAGLPTRNVFGAVRFNPHDVTDWLRGAQDLDLPGEWWR
ncbi:DNA binding domain-containing protein, excisionase family [Roseivivax halotolerans]|uniref:DNA binding domain-containing protein, excisionase family n=1 Tax=Roseivivax halotolerans TaxID=93684 RepID=A0A1I6A9E3_9RHOB|nr:helix-turn-helix domain-containing protein [Roseivivax halotolerans]SFQ65341.1 DNA binding domain-containing protein, excisionase family [Roseivivax halotolerans]